MKPLWNRPDRLLIEAARTGRFRTAGVYVPLSTEAARGVALVQTANRPDSESLQRLQERLLAAGTSQEDRGTALDSAIEVDNEPFVQALVALDDSGSACRNAFHNAIAADSTRTVIGLVERLAQTLRPDRFRQTMQTGHALAVEKGSTDSATLLSAATSDKEFGVLQAALFASPEAGRTVFGSNAVPRAELRLVASKSVSRAAAAVPAPSSEVAMRRPDRTRELHLAGVEYPQPGAVVPLREGNRSCPASANVEARESALFLQAMETAGITRLGPHDFPDTPPGPSGLRQKLIPIRMRLGAGAEPR